MWHRKEFPAAKQSRNLAALYRQWCRDTDLQFYGHFLDTVTVKHVAEGLAVKLILPVLKSKISRERDSNSRPSACVANACQTVPSMRPVMNYTLFSLNEALKQCQSSTEKV